MNEKRIANFFRWLVVSLLAVALVLKLRYYFTSADSGDWTGVLASEWLAYCAIAWEVAMIALLVLWPRSLSTKVAALGSVVLIALVHGVHYLVGGVSHGACGCLGPGVAQGAELLLAGFVSIGLVGLAAKKRCER